MSEKFEVELPKLPFTTEHEWASSYGMGARKSLKVVTVIKSISCGRINSDVYLEVEDHKEIVYTGDNLELALRVFNECR